MTDIRIGIDLGGTKIEGIALDAQGATLWRERVPTPQGDYDGTIEAISGLIERIERDCRGRGSVGIGTPGSTSPSSGLHRNSNSLCLNGRALHRDIETRLARTVLLTNDANCFALSEALTGAARGANVVFGVILGTGVGGGVVVNGRALHGHNGIAGEWGHSPTPDTDRSEREARPCYCGLHGCREQFLSGPAIEREHFAAFGVSLTVAEIARHAQRGTDLDSRVTIMRLIERLSRSLSEVVNLLDPDCIVLGGGVSNVEALYEAVPPLVARFAFTDTFTTPIVRAMHGDSSGVFGAAML